MRRELDVAAGGSALERRIKDLEPAHNIPILQHLQKFAIVIDKRPHQPLGKRIIMQINQTQLIMCQCTTML